MAYVNHFIKGVPYSRTKTRGKPEAPEQWTEAIKEQTKHLPRVKHACLMKVTFLLPPAKYPGDLPYGPDLDNLLKRLLDALNQTIFSEAAGGDSCVISLTVMKTRVSSRDQSGVQFEILPVQVS